jgi:catechol 2,3-dioxygenase-like lactoylglutathione lyase family enzyme
MSLLRLDNIGVFVSNLDAAVAFFEELGLALEGRQMVEGEFADACTGLTDQLCEIAMMVTPDGHSRLELCHFHRPTAAGNGAAGPVNTLGVRKLMFAVTDIHDTIERLKPHGAELVGELANYQDLYLLCYLRGPDGIIVALAEQLGDLT